MIQNINSVYFLGIGGIGMSAIARYFVSLGKTVSGYDRTETPLTQKLVEEGMNIHYTDDINLIPDNCKSGIDKVLVVLTPAIPSDSTELKWFQSEGYTIMKRSQVLGEISRTKKTIAVSGTHGKTTITTLISFLLKETGIGCDSFMGGISKNYGTNLLIQPDSQWIVAEADEFDRSFHRLSPHVAVISALDADHLDIYGNYEAVKESFSVFTSKVDADGILLIKKGVSLDIRTRANVYTYSLDDTSTDFYAKNIRVANGKYLVDFHTPFGDIPEVMTGVPGLLNVENAVAAVAVAVLLKAKPDIIRDVMPKFEGVVRRFDIRYKSSNVLYIDDYGHHPAEILFTLQSIRELYPSRNITVVFQPHLYTRTRDFASEFAKSLSLADSVILLDIYPAREQPIVGVTSQIILKDITSRDKELCSMNNLIDILANKNLDILVTMGAGNIDKCIVPIENFLKQNNK